MTTTAIGFGAYALVHAAVMARVLAVDGKEPASRAAWLVILLFVPVAGIVAYGLFGEPWVSRRLRRQVAAASESAGVRQDADRSRPDVGPMLFQPAFHTCEALAGSSMTTHNKATLARDANSAIDGMVADFDAARETIHVSFYIWLTDRNGLKVVEALKRAAHRGVRCRVIADSIGSRTLIRSPYWPAMHAAGVALCASMQVSLALALTLGSRVDLRNHRKIVIVDDRITWCGSQNCADPEFRIKAKYAPWVDIMLRFEGPVARQNQGLFARNWMVETGEALPARTAVAGTGQGECAAVAFGTGPLSARGAMSDAFASLLYCAQHEVVISNPYFAPDPALLAALAGCARRGVQTTLILPARNDSWLVGAISKAYYRQLRQAGVRLFEFNAGLLHAKTMVVDCSVALVGSANMHRRSLELNFENNVLLYGKDIAGQIRARQESWLATSTRVGPEAAGRWAWLRRIGDNIATMLAPVM